MSESKLEYFLGRVPASELELLQQRLNHSPIKTEQLLGRLLKAMREGDQDAEEIYKDLYPGRAFSDKQLRNLRSKLFAQLNSFLTLREVEMSPERSLFLVRALNRYQLSKYFTPIHTKEAQRLGKLPLGLDKGDLAVRLNAVNQQFQYAQQGRKSFDFQGLICDSEEMFVARILYYAVAHFDAQRIVNQNEGDPKLLLWESINQQLKSGAWSDSPLIQIYYTLCNLVRFPEEEGNFVAARQKLSSFSSLLGKDEAREAYTVVLNTCIRSLNQEKGRTLEEIFELYQEMLQQGLLLDKGVISAWRFKTILTTAVRLGEMDWARKFMEEYRDCLPAPFRENLIWYGKGLIAFYQQEFKQAEGFMNRILNDYKDPFFGLDARAYLLRIYYETENDTGMDALVNSFRLFLRRNRNLPAHRLKNYQEFIRFFRRLLALPPGKEKRAQKLKAEINASPYNAGREWLLAKIEEMMRIG